MTSARPYPPKPAEVYFFGTCLVDLIYPEAGLAAVELIEREGVRVIYPQGQTCCGQPAFNSGYVREAREVARAQLALFPKPIPIVVPSGSCGAMLRVHTPKLFDPEGFEPGGEPDSEPGGEPGSESGSAAADPSFGAAAAERAQARAEASQARALGARVFEWSEFMLHVLRVSLSDRGAPCRVTYHPSCHLLRELGVTDAPQRLLGQLRQVELVPLPAAEQCCGFGGTFSVKHGEISAAMVADKCAAVRESGADVLVSGDAGCLMNIAGALDKAPLRSGASPLRGAAALRGAGAPNAAGRPVHAGKPVRALPLAQFLKERVDGT